VEIEYLIGLDRARARYAMRLMARAVAGSLYQHRSLGRRQALTDETQEPIPLLTDEEIERFVPLVNEAFDEEPESHGVFTIKRLSPSVEAAKQRARPTVLNAWQFRQRIS